MLDLFGFYRRFVKNYSHNAKPLHDLTRNNSKFIWREEQEQSFQTLKQKLLQSPVLAYPRFDNQNRFQVDTDASDNAISAILSNNVNGVINPVCYAFRLLNDVERRASATEKELMAVIFALKLLMLSY